MKTTEIPLSWDALCAVYDEAIGKVAPVDNHAEPVGVKVTATPNNEEFNLDDYEEVVPEQEVPVEEDKPVRRTRRTRA